MRIIFGFIGSLISGHAAYKLFGIEGVLLVIGVQLLLISNLMLLEEHLK